MSFSQPSLPGLTESVKTNRGFFNQFNCFSLTTVLVFLINNNIHELNVQELQTFLFLLSNSVCPFLVPRQKTLSQQDLRFSTDLNNHIFRKEGPTYVDIFKVFRLTRRSFGRHTKYSKIDHFFLFPLLWKFPSQ